MKNILLKTAFVFGCLVLLKTTSYASPPPPSTNTFLYGSNNWAQSSNWSLGHVPTSSEDVVIPGNPSITVDCNLANAQCNNLTINNTGASNTDFAITGFLRVYGNLTKTGNGDIFIYQSNNGYGGIRIDGTMTNTGPWTNGTGRLVMYQNTSNTNAGYRHVGPIFSNQKLSNIDGNTSTFTVSGGDGLDCYYNYSPYPNVQEYNGSLNANWYHNWISFTKASTVMTPGQGYAFRLDAPSTFVNNWVSDQGAVFFTQNFGVGTITAPCSGANGGWNLVSNPNPATLDLSSCLGNMSSFFATTAYLFHATGQFTGTWGTVDNFGVTTAGASQFVAPGVGFFVKSLGSNRGFDLGPGFIGNQNSTMYKTATVDNLVRISLRNGANWNDMVIYTSADAVTNKGSKAFISPSDINITTVKDNDEYVINKLTEIAEATELPLNLMVNTDGTYSLKLDENNTTGLVVYLKDNQTSALTNLSAGNGTINLTANAKSTGRYSIVFRRSLASGINEVKNDVVVRMENNNLLINRSTADLASIEVVNALGQVIGSYKSTATHETIDLNGQPAGVIFVRVVEGKNVSTSKLVKN